jgi:hypothetical protein
MWTDILGLLQPAWSLLKKIWKSFSLWRYKRISRQPPLSYDVAKEIAYVTIASQIEDAIPYRNIDSDKIYIAVLYTPREYGFGSKVAVLEQVGQSYRMLWQSEEIIFRADLEVTDFDKDGYQEVIFRGADWGTGAHTFYLVVYSHRYHNSYTISEFVNSQNLAGPIIPEIKFHQEPPKDFKIPLEEFAIRKGFLQAPPKIDWNDPKYAIPRWHRDNGANPRGKISVVFFHGTPPPPITNVRSAASMDLSKLPFGSGIIASLDDGKIIWSSYFKNPLVGYIKESNQWFIAYSPPNFYYWATSLAYDGKRLWFGVHSLDVIFSFEYQTMQLFAHHSINELRFEIDTYVDYKNGCLFVNNSTSFSQEEIDDACAKQFKS